MRPAKPPLTTLLGRPYATRGRWYWIAGLITIQTAAATIAGLRPFSAYTTIATVIQIGCLLTWPFWILIVREIAVRDHDRLKASNGLLCLRCGQPTNHDGDYSKCHSCGECVRVNYVRQIWGWDEPSPDGADESGRATVLVKEHLSNARFSGISGLWLAIAAILLSPAAVFSGTWIFWVLVPLFLVGISGWMSARQSRGLLARRDRRECPACHYSLQGLDGWRCPECGLRVNWDEKNERRPQRESACPRSVHAHAAATLALIVVWVMMIVVVFNGYNSAAQNGLVASVGPGVPLRSTQAVLDFQSITLRFRNDAINDLVFADRAAIASVPTGFLALVMLYRFVRVGRAARDAREMHVRCLDDRQELDVPVVASG